MALGEDVGNVLGVVNPFLTRLAISIIILLIGFIIGRIISKIIHRILHEVDVDKGFRKTTGFAFSLENVFSKFAAYFIYFIAIVMALNSLGLTTFVLNMVFGAVILVVVISFFLAIKDFVPNFIAGYTIKRKGYFKPGDRIKIKDLEGKIISINLLETKIEAAHKDLIIIPNSLFSKSEVLLKRKSQ